MKEYEAWAKDTGIRALKTFAQSLVALLGAGAFNVLSTAWTTDLAIAAGAAVVSVLHNVSTLPQGTPAAVPSPPVSQGPSQ